MASRCRLSALIIDTFSEHAATRLLPRINENGCISKGNAAGETKYLQKLLSTRCMDELRGPALQRSRRRGVSKKVGGRESNRAYPKERREVVSDK